MARRVRRRARRPRPASTTTDVASDLPLSLRIDGGARWVEGDVVETTVLVRNRTDAAIHATIEAHRRGRGRRSTSPPAAPRKVDVPAHGARTVRVKLRGASAGEGRVVLVARAPGVPDDVLRHSWEIAPAGRVARRSRRPHGPRGERELGIALDHGYRIAGAPRLVLERGYDDAVAGALESLEPERQKSADALVDSLEASASRPAMGAHEGHAAPSRARRHRRRLRRARAGSLQRPHEARRGLARRRQRRDVGAPCARRRC